MSSLRILGAVCLALGLPAVAQAQDAGSDTSSAVRGVNPADNLTKFEVLPRLVVVDDAAATSINTLTFKADRAIKGRFGINVELPLARFESPGGADNGLGDLNVRGRVQRTMGSWTGIAGVEAVVPIASAATLGAGKFQLNPTVVAVRAFSPKVFMALVAKQFFSVAGDSDRDDISQGQYRALLAYASPQGWWMLADPQLFVDYRADARSAVVLELEAGRMVGTTTGVWFRAGSQVAGSWERQDWSLSGGVRFIRF